MFRLFDFPALPALLWLGAFASNAFAEPPAAPTNFAISSEMAGELNLSWEDNADDETNFEIQFRIPPTTAWSNVNLFLPPDTESAFLSGGTPGLLYEFRVVAYNGAAESSPSNIASILALDQVTSPAYARINVGVPFSYQVTATAARGSAIDSYSAEGLPDGLDIDTDTGLLAGTPTEDGFFPAIVLVHYLDAQLPPARGRVALRIPPVPGPPVPVSNAPALSLAVDASPLSVDLGSRFEDPDTRDAVRMETTHGTISVSLFDRAAPVPVQNFLHYVDADAYTDNAFHRSVNASSFDIIQSGSFSVNGTGLASIPTVAPIVNSPGIPNDRGTLALARTSSPNSATSGWYFNALDSPGLDNAAGTGGGYSVFGRATAASLPVLDMIFALPTGVHPVVLNGGPPTNFQDFPTTDGLAPNGSNFIVVHSIARIPALAFALTGNSHPEVAALSIVDGQLLVEALAPGTTEASLTATDIDGNSVAAVLPITVLETYGHWAQGMSGGAAEDDDEPDGVPNTLEYALFGDPRLPDARAILPALTPFAEEGVDFLALAFLVREGAYDLTYTVEKSNDLLAWSPVWTTGDGFSHADVVEAVDLEGKTRITVRDPVPITPGSQTHLRLRVELGAPPAP